jgi:predicted RNase H-like nuclease (RuvC/YqgF family)
MASYMLFFALLLSSPSVGFAAATGSNEDALGTAAVQKVIQMLSDMKAKCTTEKKDEEVAFAQFQEYCATEVPALKKSIATAAETIDLLDSEIAKLTSEVAVLADEISKLQSEVASFEAEKKAKTLQREKDHAAFIAESTDYG